MPSHSDPDHCFATRQQASFYGDLESQPPSSPAIAADQVREVRTHALPPPWRIPTDPPAV